MHKILILGPQGSGKGTQSTLLAEQLEIPALSMGQLFRDEVALGTELGKELQAVINAGNLVSDELALKILGKRFKESDAQNGYILDGYPRNKAQYEAFDTLDTPTAVLIIDVPREESLKRLMSRAEIEGRADDTPELIEKRLAIYEEQTQPVIDLYKTKGVIHEIDGIGTVEEVQERIQQALDVKVWQK